MRCRLDGLVGGIDEAGRGPLAGPVVSACVIWRALPETKQGVNDSKLLTKKEREALFLWITDRAHAIGVGIATHEEIDRINILNASLLSMERALQDTGIMPDLLLIDGNRKPQGMKASRALVKGDRKCFFIACASIIAKVVRDGIMNHYDTLYPGYAFKNHKGYPTEGHKTAIRKLGVLPIHRKTFKGVKEHLAV